MSGFGSMLKDYLEYHKISQTDFADRIGISQKHMNEILNDKTNLSLELMITISTITDIDVNLIYYVENKKKVSKLLLDKYETEKDINKMLNSYYINEMEKRGWIKLKDKTSFAQKYLDLVDFIKTKDLDTFDSYLEKRFLFKKRNDSNNIKIALWINHCDNMVKNIEVDQYDPSRFMLLLDDLKRIRMNKFNEKELIDLFSKYGIILYIEDALDGSKVRGCCKVMIDTPVIYLTKYYKEKSSFYFALYHELMHIKKDYNMLKNKVFIDDDEKEIDEMALDEMIPKCVYNEILNNYKDRNIIALDNQIPLCFLYSRLAKEGKIKYSSSDYRNYLEKI